MRSCFVVSLIPGTLMLTGQAFAQPYAFVPIDVQCPSTADPSVCPAGLAPGQVAAQTSARGINARGDVVGFYIAGGKQHGFLLSDGHYISLDFPVPGVRATRRSIARTRPILPASRASITRAADSRR